MSEIVTGAVWLAGSAFALLAAVGVLRMPDVFTRMQASTKASTLGLGCLLLAFKLIDTVLPTLDEATLASRPDWLTRKWPMFLLGCAVALVVMSVSVALAVLVPLVAKRYIKVDHVLPYILGANITTLGDTLLAAFAVDSPSAVRIVLAQVLVTTLLSLVVLAFFYMRALKAMWQLQVLGAKSPRRLAVFTAALFLIPTSIIGVSALVG